MKLACWLLLNIFCGLCYGATWPTQVPFWPQYPTRAIQVLDGKWQFSYNNWKGDVTSTTIDTNAIMTTNVTMVPSSFDYVAPGYEGPRGTAFYRTEVDIVAGKKSLIYFAACSFYCNVYVDNMWIGDHRAGGYAPFWLTIPASKSTTRTLFVVVDNRWNSTTAPLHTGGDFYHLGGIHRSVIVHELKDDVTYLERVEVFPRGYSPAVIDINVVVAGNYNGTLNLRLAWDNETTTTAHTATATNGTATIKALQVPNNPALWSIEKPNLHTLTVYLSNNDSIKVRYGIRVFGIDADHRITLNGQKVKLHGHNRHTLFPDSGASLTTADLNVDLALLKDLGDNYIRGAHYPQDQRWLDICDQEGIVMWEEGLGPSVSTKNTQDAYFMKYQIQQMNEMISASVNHPSVMFWGYFNEGPSGDVDACPGYKACADTAHMRDNTRFVTWANDHGLDDKCLKYADVISFNSYPGWYSTPGNASSAISFWNNLISDAAKGYTQPITVSETGGEGLYEWINTTTTLWGQAYQQVLLTTEIKTILGNPRVSGLTLWVFADFKGNDGAQAECGPCTYTPGTHDAIDINIGCDGKCGLGCRPCGENHKGTVDFWRRKKLVYNDVKTLYHQQWP